MTSADAGHFLEICLQPPAPELCLSSLGFSYYPDPISVELRTSIKLANLRTQENISFPLHTQLLMIGCHLI